MKLDLYEVVITSRFLPKLIHGIFAFVSEAISSHIAIQYFNSIKRKKPESLLIRSSIHPFVRYKYVSILRTTANWNRIEKNKGVSTINQGNN